MHRSLGAAFLVAALSLALLGCGSSSSSTTAVSNAASGPPAAPAPSTPATPTTETTHEAQPSGQGSSSQTPENSIQSYGSAAPSALKGTLVATAFTFFRAMASSDYTRLCAGLSASNRKQLEAFTKAKRHPGGCPALLKMLIGTRGVPEARKAAAGRLTSVRVKGSTAFVVFQPKGGVPSYFVLKREGGAWRALSLTPGTPLNPLASLSK